MAILRMPLLFMTRFSCQAWWPGLLEQILLLDAMG
jgi:hypothetical protein